MAALQLSPKRSGREKATMEAAAQLGGWASQTSAVKPSSDSGDSITRRRRRRPHHSELGDAVPDVSLTDISPLPSAPDLPPPTTENSAVSQILKRYAQDGLRVTEEVKTAAARLLAENDGHFGRALNRLKLEFPPEKLPGETNGKLTGEQSNGSQRPAPATDPLSATLNPTVSKVLKRFEEDGLIVTEDVKTAAARLLAENDGHFGRTLNQLKQQFRFGASAAATAPAPPPPPAGKMESSNLEPPALAERAQSDPGPAAPAAAPAPAPAKKLSIKERLAAAAAATAPAGAPTCALWRHAAAVAAAAARAEAEAIENPLTALFQKTTTNVNKLKRNVTLKLDAELSAGHVKQAGSMEEVMAASHAAREELRAFTETKVPEDVSILSAFKFGLCVFNFRQILDVCFFVRAARLSDGGPPCRHASSSGPRGWSSRPAAHRTLRCRALQA